MTTCDFTAKRLGSDDHRIGFSNGLGGPATAAFLRLRQGIIDGDIEGRADFGSASARVTGAVLRDLLTGLGRPASGEMFVERIGHEDEETLQAAIDDQATYSVSALEV